MHIPKMAVKLQIFFPPFRSDVPTVEAAPCESDISLGVCYLFHPAVGRHPQSVWAEASLDPGL